MYKILLVDDEMLIRVGLKSLINWGEHGFSIVGEACNGIDAIELIKKHNPHIVISDIKMPEMDGIELMKWTSKNYPDIKFIILSCLNEFECVREAMKLGAVDYILKLSMEADELLKVLIETKLFINQDKFIQKNENYNDHLKLTLLRKLIEDNDIRYNFFPDIDKVSLNFTSRCYIVMLLEFDNYALLTMDKTKNKDYLDLSVKNIITEVINAEIIYDYYILQNGTHALFTSIVENNNYIELLQIIFKNINEALSNFMNITVSATVSNISNDLFELKDLISQCKVAMVNKFYTGFKYFSPYSNCVLPVHKGPILTPDIESQITYAIEICDGDLLESKLNDLIAFMYEKKDIPSNIRQCMMNIVFILDKSSRGMNLPIESYSFEEVFDFLARTETLAQIQDWIINYSRTYIMRMKHALDSKYSDLVVKTLNYINMNYKNKISIRTAAKNVCVSADYLSHLFKTEMDITFTSYLNNLRINESKHLLKTSDYKVYEISDMLGYDNPNYFSKLFKKIVGSNVSDYRNS